MLTQSTEQSVDFSYCCDSLHVFSDCAIKIMHSFVLLIIIKVHIEKKNLESYFSIKLEFG